MLFYNDSDQPAAKPAVLPEPWDKDRTADFESGARDMSYYKPGKGLQDAVNAALLLRRPLLLTGEPGTGKTELAAHLAWNLGWHSPFKFETKSTSLARDLFYTYDALGHFRAVQIESKQQEQGRQQPQEQTKTVRALDYLTLGPLGLAILLSLPKDELEQRGLWDLLNKGLREHKLEYHGPRCSVVLIDEIDKAPRDFPNDILNELENLYFRLPELKEKQDEKPIKADPEMRPVVVITSNSEKHLPDAFLRRCVYFNIPFPRLAKNLPKEENERSIEDIIDAYARVAPDKLPTDNKFLAQALELFSVLRDEHINMRKRPATAELLAWLHLLHKRFPPARQAAGLRDIPEQELRETLPVLVKVKEDWIEVLPDVLKAWYER